MRLQPAVAELHHAERVGFSTDVGRGDALGLKNLHLQSSDVLDLLHRVHEALKHTAYESRRIQGYMYEGKKQGCPKTHFITGEVKITGVVFQPYIITQSFSC